MVVHRPPTQKLKAFEVLDEVEVGKMLKFHKLLDDLFLLSIGLKKSYLDFLILLNDEHLLHSQGFAEFLNLLPCFVRLAHCLNKVLPYPGTFCLNRLQFEL